MKRICACLVGMTLLFSISFANSLTLDDAIKLAKENSAGIAMVKAEERQQKNDYYDAQTNTREWKAKKSYAFEYPNEYLLYHGKVLEQAELKYNLFLTSLKNAEDNTEYNLLNTVYNLELADCNIKLLEKNIELMERQKIVYELKYKLNRITKIELDSFNLKLESTKNALKNAKDQRELAYDNLKIMLKTQDDVMVELPEIDLEELNIEDLDKFIEENINNNKMVCELDYNYKVMENNYIALEAGFFDDSPGANSFAFQKKVMKDNYEAMGIQVGSSKSNIEMLYRSLYNKIKNSELEIEQARQNLEMAKTNINIVEERFNAGYVARLDYEAAKLNFENEELTYKTKLIENLLLNVQFKVFVNSGAGVNG